LLDIFNASLFNRLILLINILVVVMDVNVFAITNEVLKNAESQRKMQSKIVNDMRQNELELCKQIISVAKCFDKRILFQLITPNNEFKYSEIAILILSEDQRKIENKIIYKLSEFVYIDYKNELSDIFDRIVSSFHSYMLNIYGDNATVVAENSYSPKAHKCPNCGANLKAYQRKCDYCLTEFW
jgi:hypothetical protein